MCSKKSLRPAQKRALAIDLNRDYKAPQRQCCRVVMLKAGANAEMIARDANALIGALELGEKAEVVAAIGADQPIVPITAVKEYLRKGDINLLRSFLKELGTKIAPISGTEVTCLVQHIKEKGKR